MNIIQQKAIEKLNAQSAAENSIAFDSANTSYVLSPECIFYSVKDVMEMTGYSEKVVLEMFHEMPRLGKGRKMLVEAHHLINYCSTSHM